MISLFRDKVRMDVMKKYIGIMKLASLSSIVAKVTFRPVIFPANTEIGHILLLIQINK